MIRAEFDPSDLAYVEQPIKLSHDSAGTVEIVQEAYHHLTLRAQMQTSGLVVLADRWDAGWRAYVNDVEVPILRVNHAVRGVLAGPGTSTIRFVYLPAGFYPRTRHHRGRRTLPFDLGVRYHCQKPPGFSQSRLIEAARVQLSALSFQRSAVSCQLFGCQLSMDS